MVMTNAFNEYRQMLRGSDSSVSHEHKSTVVIASFEISMDAASLMISPSNFQSRSGWRSAYANDVALHRSKKTRHFRNGIFISPY